MRARLNQALLELRGDDFEAVQAFAIDVILAGDWTEDVAEALAIMVCVFHRHKLEAFVARVAHELEGRRQV